MTLPSPLPLSFLFQSLFASEYLSLLVASRAKTQRERDLSSFLNELLGID